MGKTSQNQIKSKKEEENKTQRQIKKEKTKSKPIQLEESSHDDNSDLNNQSFEKKFENKLKIVKSSLKLNDKLLVQAVFSLKQILTNKANKENNVFYRKEEESLFLNFTFSNLPSQYSMRPILIPSQLNSFSKRKICLIIKDPKEEWENLGISFDTETDVEVNVISYSSLKHEYSQYEQKRQLLKQFDLFICDFKIYMMLKKVVGKVFYKNKKYPFPVFINKNKENSDETKKNILTAARNTLFYMSNGPNYSVKVGFVDEKEEDLIRKIHVCSEYVVANILKFGVEFEDLKGISLKFTNSIELPIYVHLNKEEIEIGKKILLENKDKDNDDVKDKDKEKSKNKVEKEKEIVSKEVNKEVSKKKGKK